MKARLICLLSILPLVAFAAEPERKQLSISPRGATIDVALSVTPTTGYCPYQATATWSASGASVCQKSGSWSGQANASGSESVSIGTTSVTFTMTCSTNTDYRDLTWTNPTTNTDNSAATLTGNKVYHGPNAAEVQNTIPISITPAATTYRVSGLPAGTRYFGVKALGTAGVESAMSNLVNATITVPTGVKTVTVGCTTPPPPKPPTGVTIASTVWEYVIRGSGNNQHPSPGRDVGVIGLGTLCLFDKPVIPETNYWAVPKSEVKLYRNPKSNVLLGQCEVQETSTG